MGSRSTRMMANISVDHMQKIKFKPKTILNIGVGSCPELHIWRKRLSDVQLLGVDIRHGRWDAPCVHTAVGDSIKDAYFCNSCKSLKCVDQSHSKSKMQIRTIDDIVEEKKPDGPFFLWIEKA